jgi:hypothetical protein
MTWNTSNKTSPVVECKEVIFVGIKPEGFIVDTVYKDTLNFVVQKESQVRKLWEIKDNISVVTCFSMNGQKSFKGKNCSTCQDNLSCQLKLRIFFRLDSLCCCLELPKSSYENYRRYTTKLLESGLYVRNVTTTASIIDRGYWGEVCFSTANTKTNIPLQSSE